MTDQPTGTVTFLFTDIEGSTRLWEQHPETMRRALARHDLLLRQAIEGHGGHVFKTMGDEFCAVFAAAPEAVAAVIAAQLALRSEPWAETGPLRARMALATGTAEQREGDYFGPALNRVARLLAAGHGGQILLSQATQQWVCQQLPTGAALRDLGLHRLKDLIQPEQIFQVLHPDLPQAFPPLLTLELRPHHLPVQPTPLVGRETELEQVSGLLQRHKVRLVTLTGPGGTGKTRLALQLAAELLDHFRDGAFFVDLAPLRDPALLAATIAQVLGIRETEGQPLFDTLTAHLRPKQLLLLLDNFEQLLAAAPVVAELLSAAPGLQVLVTSRAVLQLRAEHEYPVPPLPAARAVELFRQRAAAVAPHFRLTTANAAIVTAICQRLEGLPLAIELAVGRLKLFPPQVLLARLDTRLPLLTGGARDLPTRQQTLRSAIAWSYDLLTEPEQHLFRRLSVFAGGFSLAAAEAVCSGEADRPLEVLAGIAALVDQSLLRQEQAPDPGTEDEVRFRVLETIREFGQECLAQSGEAEAIRRQHALFFLTLAEAEREQEQRLVAERDNLRAALAWVLESGEAGLGFRFAEALIEWWVWHTGSPAAEGRAYLARLLALLTSPSLQEARARTLDSAGSLASAQSDYGAARAFYEESLAICEELGQRDRVGSRHGKLGRVAKEQGDFERVRAHFEQSLRIAREVGDQDDVPYLLSMMGQIARLQGDLAGADAYFQECLAVLRALGREGHYYAFSGTLLELALMSHAQNDEQTVRALREELLALAPADRDARAHVCMHQGHLLLALGDYAGARCRYEEGLALRRQAMSTPYIPWALLEVGHAAWLQGEAAVTQAHTREALALFQELEHTPGLLAVLESLAGAALAQGQLAAAARLMGAAVSQREALRVYGPEHWPPFRERIEAAMGAAALEQEYAGAWAAGRALSLEQAVAYALEEGANA
jgi:predicted ATPase/class 3 adenylate cyclase